MILSNTIVVKANKNYAVAIRGVDLPEIKDMIDGWMEREDDIIGDDVELQNYEDHYTSIGRYSEIFIDWLLSQVDEAYILSKAGRYLADIIVRDRLVRRQARADKRLGKILGKEA